MSKKEYYNSFNTLACIPKILLNEKAVVYLRNDCWIAGEIIDADGFMNITFEKSVYCNEKGEHHQMDNFMVRFRQILYIQIPDNVSHMFFVYKPIVACPFNLKSSREVREKREKNLA